MQFYSISLYAHPKEIGHMTKFKVRIARVIPLQLYVSVEINQASMIERDSLLLSAMWKSLGRGVHSFLALSLKAYNKHDFLIHI